MKKLIATTVIAFALASPAMAFDISTIDGIPSDMKDMIAKQSGGRITNKQAQQAGQQGQQQAGQDGQ
jgi:opacity protein-like surface antigen